MQMDVLSMRAVESLPALLAILSKSTDPRMKTAHDYLTSWDGRMETDRVGASIFDIFFSFWTKTIAAERFPEHAAALLAEASYAIGSRLLNDDGIGWFKNRTRHHAALESMSRALDHLENRLGPDMSTWSWGKIHSIFLNHLLSHHADLKELLQRGGYPVHGNGITVCNTGFDPNYLAAMGANWRHNADLSEDPPGLWAVDAAGQSGHPGSPHYCDQLPEWLAGRHRYIPLDRKRAETDAESRLVLTPPTK
jgi:penicillin amidase